MRPEGIRIVIGYSADIDRIRAPESPRKDQSHVASSEGPVAYPAKFSPSVVMTKASELERMSLSVLELWFTRHYSFSKDAR